MNKSINQVQSTNAYEKTKGQSILSYYIADQQSIHVYLIIWSIYKN
jgi:hypothetical protein